MSLAKGVPLTAELVEAFAGMFLSPMYDDPVPVAPFHRECWNLYVSPRPFISIAAPRGHAKSTALTHSFILAAVLFRWESHVMLFSSTEEMAMSQLGDMSKELHENEDLIQEFQIERFVTDSKGEIVVHCRDGYEFRILARGADQRIRGIKWRGRRPGLVVLDDVEEDEQVESVERRNKFGRWVRRALIPMGRRGCRVRWHGTILHIDSMLARTMKSASWTHRLYRAHASFDDFSSILWPEQFSEERLREVRQVFIDDNDAPGYSQEYLNDPHDNADAYIKRDWFQRMTADDYDSPKIFGCSADFAISTKDAANRTSLTAGGMDAANLLHHIGQDVGRWDSAEIVDHLFDFAARHQPDVFWVEDGQIWLSLWPTIRKEMQRRGRWINFLPRKPIKDKASRGRSFQKRMRGGGCRWDMEAEWFIPMQEEILRFTAESEATLDDQFDSAALLSLGFEDLASVEAEDLMGEAERRMIEDDPRASLGRNATTGY